MPKKVPKKIAPKTAPKTDSLTTSFKCRITTKKETEIHCSRCGVEDRWITKTLHHKGKVLDTGSVKDPEKYILLSNTILINNKNFMTLLEKIDELEDRLEKLEG